MQTYLQKFDELYKGKKSIDIELFSDEPLSIKYQRFNQSGNVCSCMENSNKAKQKTKNGWQEVDCNESCQYRQKDEKGKSACNRIAWLKFIIPSIAKDRIFLMRISGQTSINRLDDYFSLQKQQGNSIKGLYTLFLKQEEQSNLFGKTFNNYVLDILKKNDFISKNTISKTTEIKNDNVNSVVDNEQTVTPSPTITDSNVAIADKKETQTEKTKVKKTTAKSKKDSKSSLDTPKSQEQSNTISKSNFENCYVLLETFNKAIVDKTGTKKDYLVGKFADSKDKICEIIVRPEDAKELVLCDLGTVVRPELVQRGENKFAIKLEFIEKVGKKVAA